jgi:nucleoside-diphosphate-sugar epimerase
MKVLIAGNMGYIGPVVVQHLRSLYPAATIVGVDTGFFAGCLLDPFVFPETSVDLQYFADIRTMPDSALNGVDAVIDLAALSNDPLGNRFSELTLDVNFRAAVNLAKRAKAAGAKSFVFASSCSVYGHAAEGARTEMSPVNPLTTYARSKVAAEKALAEVASPDFLITCLRFATACGASPRLRLDLVLNDFVANAVACREIRILSDGTPWRPLIAVRDMARAIEWAALSRNTSAGLHVVVNVGSDDWNWQIRDLAKAVASVVPGTAVLIAPDGQPDARSYRVDFGLFRALAPRHQPTASLFDTVGELKGALESAGFRDAGFRRSRFNRLHVLATLFESKVLAPHFDEVPV